MYDIVLTTALGVVVLLLVMKLFFPLSTGSKRDKSRYHTPERVNNTDADIGRLFRLTHSGYAPYVKEFVSKITEKDGSLIPLFQPRFDTNIKEQRELASARIKFIAEKKLLSVFDLKNNYYRFFEAQALMGGLDPSTATKMTVQWNLFGGTLLKLANSSEQTHSKVLSGVDDLSCVGCFALTELGYGNNAVAMETTAEFDAASGEFVLNTPTDLSQKFWITNGAEDARWSIVFAQLIMGPGLESEGVHAFLCRIREEDGSPSEGVEIVDMGHKLACNGVDNARISLTNVRVPLTALLDKYSQVDASGSFKSAIPSKRGRFLVVADQLLSGRICLSVCSMEGAKICLYNAIMYSTTRRQFGEPPVPILTFVSQQLALCPLIAELYALTFALDYCKDRYARQTEADHLEVVSLICALKPTCTWAAVELGTTCRERCGGQGFLSCNQFSTFLTAGHAAVTAEGDNIVLMQKAAKEVLTLFKVRSAKDGFVKTGLNYLASVALPWLLSGLGLGPSLFALDDQLKLFRARTLMLTVKMARVMRGVPKEDIGAVWNRHLDYVIPLATAYAEQVALERFIGVIERADITLKPTLQRLCSLYALTHIERSIGLFIELGLVVSSDIKAIKEEKRNLCSEVAAEAVPLVSGLAVREFSTAPISKDWVAATPLHG